MNHTIKELLPISILIAGAGIILFGLGNALVPLSIALLLAYLLFPIIRRLESKGIKREVAIASVLFAAAVTGAILVFFLVPVLVQDMKEFLLALPNMAETAFLKAEAYAGRFGYEFSFEKETLINDAKSYLSGFLLANLKSIGLFFGKAFSGIAGLLLSVLNLLLIPVFFFYLITDYERISQTTKSLIPARSRTWFDSFVERTQGIINAYFRGQLLVALVLGLVYGVVFSIIGLRFGFVIGLLTGFLNLIPIAGPLVGIGIGSTVALAHFDGYGLILGVWAIFIIMQGLESIVITPKIVGNRVGLNSLETMLALIIGGNLAGFIGMLIAVPLGGIAKLILLESKKRYLKGNFYNDNDF